MAFTLFASLILRCQESCFTNLHFSKSQLFSLFLTYNLMDVLYVHDLFTDAKSYVKRTSHLVPDTLDMFVKLTKHFLETLEKKFQLKT